MICICSPTYLFTRHKATTLSYIAHQYLHSMKQILNLNTYIRIVVNTQPTTWCVSWAYLSDTRISRHENRLGILGIVFHWEQLRTRNDKKKQLIHVYRDMTLTFRTLQIEGQKIIFPSWSSVIFSTEKSLRIAFPQVWQKPKCSACLSTYLHTLS